MQPISSLSFNLMSCKIADCRITSIWKDLEGLSRALMKCMGNCCWSSHLSMVTCCQLISQMASSIGSTHLLQFCHWLLVQKHYPGRGVLSNSRRLVCSPGSPISPTFAENGSYEMQSCIFVPPYSTELGRILCAVSWISEMSSGAIRCQIFDKREP